MTGTFHLGSVDVMSHGEFFEKIVNVVSPEKNILKFNSLGENGNTLCWGLTSNRDDIPESLLSTESRNYFISTSVKESLTIAIGFCPTRIPQSF